VIKANSKVKRRDSPTVCEGSYDSFGHFEDIRVHISLIFGICQKLGSTVGGYEIENVT